ncbi:MAG TPA: alpha/beta hydrolase-fold protein [Sphingomicrobium sp.]|nr:alpha/beta hydrolase-fold protein [Sphingomicrobium sp.]
MRTIIAVLALALIAAAPPPVEVPVQLEISASTPLSGRLIVFAEPAKAGAAKPDSVDANPFAGTPTAVAARDVRALSDGQVATVDADTDAVPGAWSKLPPGRYHLQAVLDVDGNYNYAGRGAGDVISKVVDVTLPGPIPAVALSTLVPAEDPYAAHNPRQQALAAYFPKLQPVDFVSPKLSAFWGRPVHMRGWVALPPDYDAKSGKTWPTVYQTHGFGGGVHSARWAAASYLDLMAKGRIPPMIYVALDESSPTGTHEFADSVNNGPWGAALTTELMPWLEQHYRMDAKPSGRFLTGHSSGGWATLWLQTRYPTVFGGTWSTSPDPSDFHDFTGADLYRANANVYVDASGKPVPLVRMKGRDVANFEDFARLEAVLGPIGGQMASFDWVFSPKGPDGRPMQMFDRRTGAVDPAVAAYWRDNYDIAYRLKRDWPSVGKDLDGKIHVIVGTADTFHLDGAAHKLQAVLQGLGAKADVRFLPGKTHMDLYAASGDPQALTVEIAKEMYAVARPNGVVGTAAAGGR